MTRATRGIAALVMVLAGMAPLASAQSLLDNDFYKKAKDLLAQSQTALDAGDYDGASALAQQARASLAQSDDYVATMTQFYRANGWLSMANDRIAYARSIKADTNYKDAFSAAVADAASAKDQLGQKNYPQSVDFSKKAIDELKEIAPVTAKAPEKAPPTTPDLPAFYTVRLTLPLRDCLWRIAGFPWVYNNPWKWRLLYEANKSILEDPANPDLIEVGQHLSIPGLAGETRSGDYDPALQYPTVGAAAP